MDDERRQSRLRTFLFGGVIGAGAALAAARRKRPTAQRQTPAGLAAFEEAPCFKETVEREQAAQRRA
jgi:hypothetical protein